MKLFNTIVVFDIYTVAETNEAAWTAALAAVRDSNFETDEDGNPKPLDVSTTTALEAREKKNVRTAWVDKRPLVAADISDEDFEKLKGKTTLEIHAMLYGKQEPKK